MINKLILAGIAALISFPFIFPIKAAYAFVPDPGVIIVDDFSDAPDFYLNHECSVGAVTGGPCTLRAAIDEANFCSLSTCPEGVVIKLPPGTYTLTIFPTGDNDNSSGDLDIEPMEGVTASSPFVIEAVDPAYPPVIDANGVDRVFHIYDTPAPITFRNLVIRGGTLLVIDAETSGMEGAGVLNYGNLTLENVIIKNNQFLCPSNDAKICWGLGGGILTEGYLLMKDSTVRNNTAFTGGGIVTAGLAEVNIFSSTVSGNHGVYGGGGIVNSGLQLQIENSTISDNISEFFGGIFNLRNLDLFNVTIASNMATDGGAANLYNSADGIIIKISNSIIAYPIGPDPTENCWSTVSITNLGINLYSDSSCGTGAGILSNTDPKLTPLGWFGGATMTRGLLVGSPAHDAVTGFCLDHNSYTLTFDQRGENRDNKCDLGAFEGEAYGMYLPVITR